MKKKSKKKLKKKAKKLRSRKKVRRNIFKRRISKKKTKKTKKTKKKKQPLDRLKAIKLPKIRIPKIKIKKRKDFSIRKSLGQLTSKLINAALYPLFKAYDSYKSAQIQKKIKAENERIREKERIQKFDEEFMAIHLLYGPKS